MDNKDLLPEDNFENDEIEEKILVLLHKIGQYENECLQQEIEEDREQCRNLDVTIPKLSQIALEHLYDLRLWKPQKKKYLFSPLSQVAFLLIAFILIGSVMLIVDRENVTAFRRIVNGIVSTFTNESEDIRSQEVPLPEYITTIPEGFEKVNSDWNDTLMTFQYENTNGEFLKITIYKEGYFVSFDNEDLEVSKDVIVNGFQGKKLVKNELTLFYIYYGQQMITIVSNLPESQVNDFAEGIKPLKEGGTE